MLPETTAHKLKGTKIRILASHGYKSAIEYKIIILSQSRYVEGCEIAKSNLAITFLIVL